MKAALKRAAAAEVALNCTGRWFYCSPQARAALLEKELTALKSAPAPAASDPEVISQLRRSVQVCEVHRVIPSAVVVVGSPLRSQETNGAVVGGRRGSAQEGQFMCGMVLLRNLICSQDMQRCADAVDGVESLLAKHEAAAAEAAASEEAERSPLPVMSMVGNKLHVEATKPKLVRCCMFEWVFIC